MPRRPTPKSELTPALRSGRSALRSAAGLSFAGNLLMLVPAVYMLQLYDRVLTSGSAATLFWLSALVAGLFLLLFGFESLRSLILQRLSSRLDRDLASRVYDASADAALAGGPVGTQAADDLSMIRQALTSPVLAGLFDAPWIPIYIAALFLLHPLLGLLGIGGALALAGLAVAGELRTRRLLAEAGVDELASKRLLAAQGRSAEVTEALGMRDAVRTRWTAQRDSGLAYSAAAGERSGVLAAGSKVLRLALQSAALGLGAWLAVQQQITPGMMIAGSILLGRALAPVDVLVGGWRQLISGRQAWQRLSELLSAFPARKRSMSLPEPKGELTLRGVVAAPPGVEIPVLRGLSLSIQAGSSTALIGPSAAGKSTLARVLLGVWPLMGGSVRLDGAEVGQLNRDELGPHIGYLPQDIELSAGTVAQNIARFGEIDPAAVVAAAQAAQVHDLILHLPLGYDTPIGDGGAALSGGQRQRIGLARALYSTPRLVVLDEPSSSLDDDGEAALVRALGELKARGVTVVVITHRRALLRAVDQIAVLRAGALAAHGPRDEILAQLTKPALAPRPAARAA